MSKLRAYRWIWLDKFMKKFFKKRYMKKYIKLNPAFFYEQTNEDGTTTVMIDLHLMFDPEDLPTHEELDSMIDIYYKIKKI